MQNVSTKCWVTTIPTPVSLELPSTLSALRMSSVLYTLNVWSDPAKVKPNLLEMVSKFDLSRGKSLAGSKTLTFFIWRNWKSWKTRLTRPHFRTMCLTLAWTNNLRKRTCHVAVSSLEIKSRTSCATRKAISLLCSLFDYFSKQKFLLLTHTLTLTFVFEEHDSFKHVAHFSGKPSMLTWAAGYTLWN